MSYAWYFSSFVRLAFISSLTTELFLPRYNNNNTAVELYDLDKDIGETTNVASHNAEAVQQAIQLMEKEHVNGNYCNGH